MEKIDVVILCGGLATRLGYLVKDNPKILVEVNGKPFLYYLLYNLWYCYKKGKENGYFEINSIIYACGNIINGLKITEYNVSNKIFSVQSLAVPDGKMGSKLLGTAGSLKNIENYINFSKNILVINGDSYVSKEYLYNFINFNLIEYKNTMMIGMPSIYANHNYPDINWYNNGLLIKYEFNDKKENIKYSSAGYYMFSSEILNNIPVNIFYSLENDVIPKLQKEVEMNVSPIRLTDMEMFYDIGTPEGLKLFEDYAISEGLLNAS